MKKETRAVRDGVRVPDGFASLVRPVHRASTILFEDAEAFDRRRGQFLHGYWYGLSGTPTHYALAGRIADLEGGTHCMLAPSGLGAINLINQAFLASGAHVLVSDTVYGPTRQNLLQVMGRYGVEAEFFPPALGSGIAALFRPTTRLVWLESPGSLTIEVQDVPAIAAAAHAQGVRVALDNTWASPLHFDAFAHGVDFSVQALTKYLSGHADVLMGSVCVRDVDLYARLKETADLLGNNVSPDDCSLVLRGLLTLGVRMARHQQSALAVGGWLAARPEVLKVLYPPLESDAGHGLWKRDFTGGGGLMTVLLRDSSWAAASAFANALQLFCIGASWGGPQSLAGVYRDAGDRTLPTPEATRPLVRLSIGLEDPQDLIDDLQQALAHAAPSFLSATHQG